jgi:hypothetical protein
LILIIFYFYQLTTVRHYMDGLQGLQGVFFVKNTRLPRRTLLRPLGYAGQADFTDFFLATEHTENFTAANPGLRLAGARKHKNLIKEPQIT